MPKIDNSGADSALENEASSSSSSENSDEEEEMDVEYLAPNRSRRATAGNKMSTLIECAQEDDFYKSAYGGFNEDEVDNEYASPVHSDHDEVDSDFDRSEEEDEPVSGNEDEEKRPRRKRAFKEPTRGTREELLAKNKTWAVARMGGPVVAANVVDAKTQAQRLKEAEETERINIESLQKYEAIELDRKKKREKASIGRRVPPPYISFKSTAKGDRLTVPDLKAFNTAKPDVPLICAVTGRPAKYKDPLTGLPYASPYAFKVIRDQYNKYLMTIKDNPEVDSYLSQFILDA